MLISLKLNMHDNIKFRYFPSVIVTFIALKCNIKKICLKFYTWRKLIKNDTCYKGENIIQYRTYNSDSIIPRGTN